MIYKEVGKILDKDGHLTIPLTLKGTPPAVIVIPNISKLLEIGGKKVLQEKATELLGRALGGNKNSDSLKGLGKALGF